MTTWAQGDYPRMARALEPAAERALEYMATSPGAAVLDVACGTGNIAVLAAQAGAAATGVDTEPALLQIAAERAASLGVEVSWLPGSAEELPVATGEFAAVASVFGVIYSLDPHAAVSELARAGAPGASVVVTTWAEGSLMPSMGAALAPYLPAPPAPARPVRWVDEEMVTGLMGSHGLPVHEVVSAQLTLSFDGSADAADFLIDTAGHVVAERARLVAEGRWQSMRDDLEALVLTRRLAGSAPGLTLPLDYKIIAARREG